MEKQLTREEWDALKRRAAQRTIISSELDATVICAIAGLFAFYAATAALMFSPLWWLAVVPCALISALMARDVWIHEARTQQFDMSYRDYVRKRTRLETRKAAREA